MAQRVLPEKLAKWHKAVGERVQLVNTYGPTETTIVATKADVMAITESEVFPNAPIGRAIQNVQTYIESQDFVKPNDPLQYQLVQIWEELFDHRPIGVDARQELFLKLRERVLRLSDLRYTYSEHLREV